MLIRNAAKCAQVFKARRCSCLVQPTMQHSTQQHRAFVLNSKISCHIKYKISDFDGNNNWISRLFVHQYIKLYLNVYQIHPFHHEFQHECYYPMRSGNTVELNSSFLVSCLNANTFQKLLKTKA